MKISFEVDARLIVVTSLACLAGLFALHGAYPALYGFWPSGSQDLAAWVQAVGSVAAIAYAGRFAAKQIEASHQATEQAAQRARELATDLRRLDDLKRTEMVWTIVAKSCEACKRVRKVHSEGRQAVVADVLWGHLTDSAAAFERLPAFDIPSAALSLVCVVLPMQLRGIHEVASIERQSAVDGYMNLQHHHELEIGLASIIDEHVHAISLCEQLSKQLRRVT